MRKRYKATFKGGVKTMKNLFKYKVSCNHVLNYFNTKKEVDLFIKDKNNFCVTEDGNIIIDKRVNPFRKGVERVC